MAKLTERNTKKDILDSYNKALEEIKIMKSNKVDRRSEVKDQHDLKVVEVASSSSVADIVKSLADLRIGTNETISNLEESILEKKSQLDGINKAIVVQKDELSKIHKVSVEADSLAALIEAQAQESTEFDEMVGLKREAFEVEVATGVKNTRESLDEERKTNKRRVEEYEYNFKLRKERDSVEFENEKAVRERKLDSNVEKIEAILQGREDSIELAEDELVKMRETVATEGDRVKSASDKAVAIALASEKASRLYETAALKKQIEHESAISANRITMFMDKVEDLNEEIRTLRDNLNVANTKVQTIASDAIAGAQTKIIQSPVASK